MTVSRDHYYRLSSDLESERIQAAVALINELVEAKDDEEWDYALKRLIKGLASSRGSSRLGFSTCLTEIVNIRISDGSLTFSSLIDEINSSNKTSSSMNGKEERAALFGKLFGLQSLSNLISEIGSNAITEDDFKLFVDNLIQLAGTKSWIREPSLFTIFNLIKNNYSKLSESLILYIFEKIDENKLSLTTESLALYLSVPKDFRASKISQLQFQNKTWSNFDPLNRSNLSLLSKVLKDVNTGDDDDSNNESANSKKSKGTWSPRLHFVWNVIVEELSTTDSTTNDEQLPNSKKRSKSNEKKSKKHKTSTQQSSSNIDFITIPEFWKVIIDESFFNEKASHERKYTGFSVFQVLYKTVPVENVSSLFSQNFLRTLINQASDNNRILNKVAKKSLTTIVDTARGQPLKVIPTIKQLLVGKYGSLQFDRLTKTKTVETLINLDVSNEDLASFFIEILNDQNQTENLDENIKNTKWTIDQILHLIRTKKSKLIEQNSDLKWVDIILENLVKKAYLKSETSTPLESEDVDPLVEFTQERLNSILSDIISIKRTDNKTWPYKTLSFLLKSIKNGETALLQFDEELNSTKDRSLKILKEIRSNRDKSDDSQLLVFELLFSMVLLQLFAGDSESVNTLEELQDYYAKYKEEHKNGDKNTNGESIDTSVGIIEILLSFLSQKSSLLKKLSLIVWENFCDKVGSESLSLLLDVVVTKENKEGQTALFEGEGEYIDEDASEEEHDHDHSDDENDSSEESEEDSDSDSDDSSDDGDDLVEEVEKKTNVALAEALQIPYNGEVTLSSDDEDDDNLSDESMNDEQMMEIDGQLSQIFKQRRDALNNVQTGNKRKQEVEEARSNIILLKHRVFDLLEIFVKVNPNSPLIIDTIVPLLKGLKLTMDKSLGTKIHKLLKNKICKVKLDKSQLESSWDKDQLFQFLKSVQKDILQSSNTNDYNLSASQISIFIAKLIITLDENYIDEVIEIYSDLLKSWFKKKNAKLNSSMFFDFINWLNSKRRN